MTRLRHLADAQDVITPVLHLEQDRETTTLILGVACIAVGVIVAVVAGAWDSARRRRRPRRKHRTPTVRASPPGVPVPECQEHPEVGPPLSPEEQAVFDATVAHLREEQWRIL
ncbi:hypothetical protein [Sphaerisporangium sp. NPDC051011]|uniref:hypothetical protein n=1 Tax=Sphaerisporangium sp. NPDC051011 TaxID=3155792 RepID=UPI0033F508C7